MNLLSSDFAESFAKACLFDAVNRWRGISRSLSRSNGRLSFTSGSSCNKSVLVNIMNIWCSSFSKVHVSENRTKLTAVHLDHEN